MGKWETGDGGVGDTIVDVGDEWDVRSRPALGGHVCWWCCVLEEKSVLCVMCRERTRDVVRVYGCTFKIVRCEYFYFID